MPVEAKRRKGRDVENMRAVFLDRDGTINEEVGYLKRLEDLKLIPGSSEAIRLINDAGMKTVVVTNQSGIARGFFGEEFVETVHRSLSEMLRREGAFIDRFYYCPHHPTAGKAPYRKACQCRKPEPGMLLQAAQDLNLDLAQSYVVGDMLKDLTVAQRVGAKGILVRTGYGRLITATDKPAYIAEDLLQAVKWIIEDLRS
jgi:D,D-heptose 1,7-bisphosphate phosphatase